MQHNYKIYQIWRQTLKPIINKKIKYFENSRDNGKCRKTKNYNNLLYGVKENK